MNDLIIYFSELTDTRDPRGLKHELTNCIVMTIFGILAGQYNAENIAFFLKLNEEFFNKVKKKNYIKTIEKRNGDAEIREYGFTNDVEWIYNKSEWLGLKSVGFAKRTYKNFQDKIVSDIRFFILNLNATFIDIILKSIRSECPLKIIYITI